MIKLIAMLIAYRWGMKALCAHAKDREGWPKESTPLDTFHEHYGWMYNTLMRPMHEVDLIKIVPRFRVKKEEIK